MVKRSPIYHSVGVGAANLAPDVATVQHLINASGVATMSPLAVDGRIGPATIFAIEKIQRRYLHMHKPDGRVDPNGETIHFLTAGHSQTVVAHPSASQSFTSSFSQTLSGVYQSFETSVSHLISQYVTAHSAPTHTTPTSTPPTQTVAPPVGKTLTMSDQGIDFLKGWEGWNGSLNKTTGLWVAKDDGFGNGTIGWGHNCGSCTAYANGITKQQGDDLLKSDLASFQSDLNNLVSGRVTQQQFDALLSFAFNVVNWQKSTLINNASSGKAVTKENFTAYGGAHKNGKRIEVPSLIKRRTGEWNIYNSGVYDSRH